MDYGPGWVAAEAGDVQELGLGVGLVRVSGDCTDEAVAPAGMCEGRVCGELAGLSHSTRQFM